MAHVRKSFDGNNQKSAPVFAHDGRASISIYGSGWSATVAVQRHLEYGGGGKPASDDANWRTIDSYTENQELNAFQATPCWYRLATTAHSSGTVGGEIRTN